MKALITAAFLAAASFAALSVAAGQDQMAPQAAADSSVQAAATDGRSVASDAEVGVARRSYRAACGRYQNAGYCDCVTAGVAQALSPSDVRLAARTIRQRINAQGDAAGGGDSDLAPPDANAMSRIETVEGHYADACAQFRS